MALNDLAGQLNDSGQFKEAVGSATEAVALYRKLAQQKPEAYEPYLVGALRMLGEGLHGAERFVNAFEVFEEGIRLLRPHLLRLSVPFTPAMMARFGLRMMSTSATIQLSSCWRRAAGLTRSRTTRPLLPHRSPSTGTLTLRSLRGPSNSPRRPVVRDR